MVDCEHEPFGDAELIRKRAKQRLSKMVASRPDLNVTQLAIIAARVAEMEYENLGAKRLAEVVRRDRSTIRSI